MKLNNKTLILSAASLLIIMVVAIVLIRRRGRKVYLKPDYRLNENLMIYLFDKGFENSVFYKGSLDYVVVPYNYEKSIYINTENLIEPSGIVASEYVPVIATGVLQPSGRVKRFNLQGTGYIDKEFLNI